jgi:hypothetical protein
MGSPARGGRFREELRLVGERALHGRMHEQLIMETTLVHTSSMATEEGGA